MILALGASHRKLGIPGEEKFGGAGVSYCATCDGAFFRGRTTVVVGGGNVACEDAIFLSRMCEKYILYTEEMRFVQIRFSRSVFLPVKT